MSLQRASFSEEEQLFSRRIEDDIAWVERRMAPKYHPFLDERRQAIARQVFLENGFVSFCFFGGYEGAQRQMLCLFPDYMEEGELSFPLVSFYYRFRPEDGLTHRDFLGSLMGLKIGRESVGDILVSPPYAVCYLSETVAPLVASELSKVGRAGVRLLEGPPPDFRYEAAFTEEEAIVSSYRLDAVLSSILPISREQAAKLIRGSLVQVDHFVCVNTAKRLEPGNILSVRGYGKFIMGEVVGSTKKERLRFRYKKCQ